jgi:pyrimidine deaminase RibD-like protein
MKNNFIKKIKLIACLSFIMLGSVNFQQVTAQAPDSKGKDFWLMFPANLTPPTLTLFITGDVNTSGTVVIPGLAFSTPFSVTAGTITSVIIPTAAQVTSSNLVESKGIHVTSTEEVTVYGLNRVQATTDAFLGLPTDILGTAYLNLGYKNSNIVNATQFGIVASQDNTTVTITPTVTTDGRIAGIAYNIVLNQGQTYLLRNTGSAPNDLSGTSITSDKPIAVFGGHQCANIPPGAFACDFIVEQLTPTNTWGKNFVTVPLKTRLNGDTFRFIASENSTDVSVNGVLVATLNAGQLHEMIINGSSQISSTKPIMVAQYSNGTTFDGVTSDPFMMLIPPYEQFLAGYTITTPASGFALNFVNVVAPTAAVGAILLDGIAIPAGSFSPIGASGFSGAQVDITLGAHTFSGILPFGVFVYGFANADSYGYPGGMSLAPIASVTTVELTPETGTSPINTEQCWEALVKDQNGNPLEGVRVDFTITGFNPGSTGFAFTDANGIAKFCYTGTNAGDDLITASVGTITDASTFTWTDGCNITVTAKKFYDLNTNGIDDDNIPVQGWNISLSGIDENNVPVGPINQVTAANGTTAFTPLAKGSYTVTEGTVSGWVNTTPTSANLTLSTCADPALVSFGNVCLGAANTGGGGLGFWSNKNGQVHITGAYLCELNALCLRNADGSNYDPVAGCPTPTNPQVNTGKSSLKNWLLNAYATNMAYMLSAQLAALKLNVLKGYVNPSRLIYAPGTSSANAAGFATVEAVMNEANTILCANGMISAGDPLRARAEAVKNALEKASGNSNYVQLQPCSLSAPAIVRTQENVNDLLPITESPVMLLRANPNPSTTSFTISFVSNNQADLIRVRVLDLQGRVMETINNLRNGQNLQVGSKLTPGTYLIEMSQNGTRKTQLVIKQ